MKLLLVLQAIAGGSGLVWHEGELILKGEPGKVEFLRVLSPAHYLRRLDPRSLVPPAPAEAEATFVEERVCAPGTVDLPGKKGLYFVRCGDASALAVKSSLALVCATDGETVVSFCADATTGEPRPGAELSFIARGEVLLSGVADDRGLFQAALRGSLTVLAREADDLAVAVLPGLPPRSPAPVGMVALAGEAAVPGGPLDFFGLLPGEAGRFLPARAPGFGKALVKVDERGAFAGALVPRETRPGSSVLNVGECAAAFEVAGKEEDDFELRVEAPDAVVPGEEVKVELTAREAFGPALQGIFSYAVVEERFGRGRRLARRGSGEGAGRFSFTFAARAAGLYRVSVEARVKDERGTARKEKLIRCGRGLALAAEPLYARPGEEVRARVSHASGELMLVASGRARDIRAGPDGRAETAVRFEREGVHEVRVFSGGELARVRVLVYPTRAEALSLTPSSTRVRPGGEARVLVEGAARAALVLCASDRLWWARVVTLNEGWAEVRFPVLDAFGPRVELCAFAFRDGDLERASRALKVERGLSLAIEQHKEDVRLRVLDERGGAVPASLVAVVREAGGELPVPLDGFAPGFPAHVEAASSSDFASAGGRITWDMREPPRDRAQSGPVLPPHVRQPLKIETLFHAGPAEEASFPLPLRRRRGKREIVAYAFGEAGRCAAARLPLADEAVWGCVRAPGYLVEGDELWAELRLWNDSVDEASPDPQVRGEGVGTEPPRRATLSAGESLTLPFLVRAASCGGSTVSTAFGSHELDVLARGRTEEAFRSGVLEERASLTIALPRGARDCRLTVALAPTAADAAAQARRSEAEDLPRLFAREHESGGYGWHDHPPDTLSTALAALRLKQLLPDSGMMLSRTLDALGSLARAEDEEWKRAFGASVLARLGREPGTVPASSAVGLACAAVAEEERGRHARADELCGRLEEMVQEGAIGVRWGRRRARSEADSQALSTAAALRALLRAKPRSELIPEACLFLLASRKGLSWGGRLADGQVLRALEGFTRSRPKEEVAALTVAASEAGLTRVIVRAAGRTLEKEIVWRDKLPGGGPVSLALEPAREVKVMPPKKGPGRIPYSAWVEYRTSLPGGDLRVERRYSRLRLRRGEELECALRVHAPGAFGRAVVRDFIPAGLKVVRAPGAEVEPPELVYYVPRLDDEAVFRYVLRARFRGRFTALAPLVEIEGTGIRGRGEEAELEVVY